MIPIWQAKHLVVRKRKVTKDQAERMRPLATCTVCSHPFFDCVEVYEHAALGVLLCYYCASATSAAAAATAEVDGVKPSDGGAAVGRTASSGSDDDRCAWCAGSMGDEDESELFGCENDGCNQVASSTRNLGFRCYRRCTRRILPAVILLELHQPQTGLHALM